MISNNSDAPVGRGLRLTLQTFALVIGGGVALGLPFVWPALFPLHWIALVPWIVVYVHPRYEASPFWILAGSFVFLAISVAPWLPAGIAWPVVFALTNFAPYLLFPFLIKKVARVPLPLAFTVPVVWVVTEWLRVLVSIPAVSFYTLGSSQVGWSGIGFDKLIQIADLGGLYAVSFIVASMSGLIADVVIRRDRLIAVQSAIFVAALCSGALLYGHAREAFAIFDDAARVAVRVKGTSAQVMTPEGTVISEYETVAPALSPLRRWKGGHVAVYPVTVGAGTLRLATASSWEIADSGRTRRASRAGAEVLINIEGQDVSVARRAQMVALGVFRAVENRITVIRASNTGSATWIDANGRIATLQNGAANTVRTHQRHGTTVYARLGDAFVLLCAIGIAASLSLQSASAQRLLIRAVAGAVTIVIAAGLIGMTWIGTLSRLIADDFCIAVSVRDLGFLGFQKWFFLNWGGRFGGIVTYAVTGLSEPFFARVMPGLVIGSIGLATFFAVRRLSNKSIDALMASAVALAITWCVLGKAPDVYQDVFWLNGLIVYTVPLSLVAIWVGLSFARPTSSWLADLSLFFASGFNEALTAVLGIVACIGFVSMPSRRRQFGRAAIAVAAGFIVDVIAPGSWARAATYSRDFSWRVFARTPIDVIKFVIAELWNAGPALVLVFSVSALTGLRTSDGAGRIESRAAATLLAALVAALFAPFLFLEMTFSSSGPLHSSQAMHVALAVSAAVGGWALGGCVKANRHYAMVLATTLLTLGSLALQAKDYGRLEVIAKSATDFSEIWRRVDAQLHASRGAPQVTVRAPRCIGNLGFVCEGSLPLVFVSESPEYYANACMANYYRVGAVVREGSAY